MTYEQTTLLAMELDGSHVGALVQIITETWSMTGTLTRVDQHDNREWEIIYPERRLVPSGGEIYAELWIGPWRGQVIGNQPVTVERVKGTLEAPERAALKDYADTGGMARATSPRKLGWIVPEDVALGTPEARVPEEGAITHTSVPDEGVTRCGLDWWSGGVVLALDPNAATCPGCQPLPPAPADWPDLPGQG